MHFLLLNNIFSNKLAQAICWTLAHSLWQGLFFAVCACTTILCTRNSSSLIRYNIIFVLFIAFISVSGLTFLYEWQQPGIMNDALVARNHSILTILFNGYQISAGLQQFNQILSSYANFIVLLWLIIFTIKFLQTIGAIAFTYRIKTQHVNPVTDVWKEKLEIFSSTLNIKRQVKLLESGLTRIPLVIGHFKPIIFIPVGLLTQLPADQVEAVLWHELAHIRRNDYIVNFFQHIAEAIFFFNPGLLWISSIMRTERENCCDDIAISQTNNKKQFIEALISFKEYAIGSTSFAPAFPGKKNQLLQRVSRIITRKNKSLYPVEKIFFGLGIVLMIAFFNITTHLLPGKLAAKEQTSVEIKPIIIEETNQIPVAKIKKPVKAEAQENTAYHRLNNIKTNPDKSSAEQTTANHVADSQIKNELPEGLTNYEKMELDRKRAKTDQEKAIAERGQSEIEMTKARLDKLLAEKDARNAALDHHQSEQAIIQAKIDMEKSYHRLITKESKTDQKIFQ